MNEDPALKPDSDPQCDDWAATTDALRRIARSVGASAADAEDVAQGALLAGILAQARGLTPGLGWLKAKARHRMIDRLRKDRRAAQRSSLQALDEQVSRTAAPAEMVLQFEVQRRVMAAVEALPEPY